MTTPEWVQAIQAHVPDATEGEMITALLVNKMQTVREHVAPFWRQHPEMPLGVAIDALAEQGDERCIAWRDWLAH